MRSDEPGAPGHEAIRLPHGLFSSRQWRAWAAMLLVGTATLIPLGRSAPRFDAGTNLADLLLNVALFVPLGIALRHTRWHWTRVAVLALIFSGTIELLQGTVVRGRRGSPADVAANAAGALAGMVLTRTPVAALLLPFGAWLASGTALAPSPPATAEWWGQWAHHFAGTEPFEGSITAVRLLGRRAPDGPLDSTASLIGDSRRNGISLEVRLRSGGTTAGPTHLAGIADGQGHVVMALEQQGDDLLLSWWSRGAAMGLRTPRLVFRRALQAPRGDSLSIRATVRCRSATVEIRRTGAVTEFATGLDLRTGWQNLLATSNLAPRAQVLFNALWTIGGLGYAAAVVLITSSRRLS